MLCSPAVHLCRWRMYISIHLKLSCWQLRGRVQRNVSDVTQIICCWVQHGRHISGKSWRIRLWTLWSSWSAVRFHGIVSMLIDGLIKTVRLPAVYAEVQFPIPYCLPWNVCSSCGECQCLSVQCGELSFSFQISVFLMFDLLPKMAHGSQGIGGPCCRGLTLEEVFMCESFSLFFLSLTAEKKSLHSQHRHKQWTHSHTNITRCSRQTHDPNVMCWCWSGCVRPRSRSLIPLFP